jgi:hypothetical protein
VRQIVFIAAALIAGFVGGVLGNRTSYFSRRSQVPDLVRAHRFELLNEDGQPISYWGVDKGQNVVLAFARNGGANQAPIGAVAVQPHRPLDDPHGQRVSIGLLGDDSPFLNFSGPDGKPRVQLLLNLFSKPILLMEDETGPRVSLGIVGSDTPGFDVNDWALDFSPERSSIGMFARRDSTGTYVQGFLDVHRDKVKYPYSQ